MPAVLDQVKTVAYTSVGINLLVTDAIVRREVPTPDFVGDHARVARERATEALTDLRGRTEPQASKLIANLPDSIADAVMTGRTAAWDFMGIEAPAPAPKTTKTTKTAATKSAAKKAPAAKGTKTAAKS